MIGTYDMYNIYIQYVFNMFNITYIYSIYFILYIILFIYTYTAGIFNSCRWGGAFRLTDLSRSPSL